MRTAPTHRANRDLFSNRYLDERLPETEAWNEVSEDELQEAYDDIEKLWEREKNAAPKRNEARLEAKFIRPMFRRLGIPFEVEESTDRTQPRPDYGFFESEDASRDAFERREGGDFYEDAVAVADAKRWGRPLDTRGSGEHERDFENPSYQIHAYLQETPARWGVLTDGKKWRLYHAPTSHRLDSYYEIDLPTTLEKGDLEDFKYFYLFFRHGAFLEDAGGDNFLDDVYSESNVFAQELGEDLQDNVYEASKVLAEGFLRYPDNDLDEDDLDLIRDSSLVYLYRLIFVLYAESEGRDLLDANNEIYERSYGLNSLKREVVERLDSENSKYRDRQDDLQSRLDELFALVDEGSKSRGIPEEDLYIPAYNGGLFRTRPDEDDGREARFLANHAVGDAYLAKVVELLTRSANANGGGKTFVDYSSLDVRRLGSIYEGLLEYELDVADEPLALTDGEYVSADEGDDVSVEQGEVYLTTDSGERKATGSYYTPEYVVEYIVENTLEPLVEDIRKDLIDYDSYGEGGFAEEFADRVFDLKILDPAMGSGHFLTNTVDYLAREIVDAQEKQAKQQGVSTVNRGHDVNWARRQVAQRCIYGVDLNPLAVELAKASLWLRTPAAEQPLAFLDHHLKTGNSLVGSDVGEIEELVSDPGSGERPEPLSDFGVTRKGTIERLLRIYQDFIAIGNQGRADVEAMESKYDEFERDELRRRLEAMANVHTAEGFGLDNSPDDAYERMAAALNDDDEWATVERTDWLRDARRWADADRYFHWELEFPEVFYDDSGSRQNEGGFDGIIGNPPYGDILSGSEKEYCRNVGLGFESERADVFTAFVALPGRVLSHGDAWSYIIPNTPLRGSQYDAFRATNSDRYRIDEIADFGDECVFDEEVFTMIITASKSGVEDDYTASYLSADSAKVDNETFDVSITAGSSSPWRPDDRIEASITSSSSTVELEPAVCTCHDAGIDYKISGQGWQNRGDGVGISDLITYEGERESEADHRYVGGGEVDRYRISPEDKWLRHDYESYVEGDIVIQVYPEYSKVDEKLVTRQTSDALVGAIDTEELYTAKSVHTILSNDDRYDLYYVLALVNSNVLRYVHQARSGEEGRTFAQVRIHELRDLPIRRVDFDVDPDERSTRLTALQERYDGALGDSVEDAIAAVRDRDEPVTVLHDFLAVVARRISKLEERRDRYDLRLPDYLGSYSDTNQLAEIDGYRPASGVSETLLSQSEADRPDERPKLKLGRISCVDEGTTVTVLATVRYRPEHPENQETDRWGFTETDPLPAIEFVGLDEYQRGLLCEFVEYAANEADEAGNGFAGYHDNATKTKSLVDRVEAMAIPAIGEVRDGFERYRTEKSEVSRLDERIEQSKRVINGVAYDLYKLSDDQIETIESTVRDD